MPTVERLVLSTKLVNSQALLIVHTETTHSRRSVLTTPGDDVGLGQLLSTFDDDRHLLITVSVRL